MNNTNLIGRLTKKAELYQTPDNKSSLISLEGELRTRNYEKDDQKHFVMEV